MPCVNTTAVLYESDPAPLARAIAQRLSRIPALPYSDERAVLPTQPIAKAHALATYLGPKAAGTTPVLQWIDKGFVFPSTRRRLSGTHRRPLC